MKNEDFGPINNSGTIGQNVFNVMDLVTTTVIRLV